MAGDSNKSTQAPPRPAHPTSHTQEQTTLAAKLPEIRVVPPPDEMSLFSSLGAVSPVFPKTMTTIAGETKTKFAVAETPLLEGVGTGNAAALMGPGQNVADPDTPLPLFFYGSLMDPEVLQIILQLPDSPVMEKTSITGYRLKMWGLHPTLVPDPKGKVAGLAWVSSGWKDVIKLQRYQTGKYMPCDCQIRYESSEGDEGDELVEPGKTFCWRGDPNSNELQDGEFDLDFYQINIKPEILRPSPRSIQW